MRPVAAPAQRRGRGSGWSSSSSQPSSQLSASARCRSRQASSRWVPRSTALTKLRLTPARSASSSCRRLRSDRWARILPADVPPEESLAVRLLIGADALRER